MFSTLKCGYLWTGSDMDILWKSYWRVIHKIRISAQPLSVLLSAKALTTTTATVTAAATATIPLSPKPLNP